MKYAEFDRYTDKNGVLRNKLGAKSDEELDLLESRLVAMNTLSLRLEPIKGNFDLAHLQKIHHRLFSEIYEWAGELREIGITKGKTVFAAPNRIQPEFHKLHQKLISEEFEKYDKATFAKKLAYYLGEINILHPFREGNGRSQREFIIQLALKFNYRLHFQNVTPEEMIDASERSSLYVDNRLFEQIIFERLELINKESL
ncbi:MULTISPECIES: Fic/DOC family protein [unclassified Mannheimia]|uniref:Fic/DOC family protein n=1 Tax=unclassified Mannheimia TaxID=2645054 RepID=UPI00359ECD88